MTFYVLIHDLAGDRVARYSGMDQATVTASLGATPFEFIDESTYNAFIEAHRQVPLTPNQVLTALRSQAIDELTSGTQPLTKLQRAIFLVILDEINLIRSLLVPSQPTRTVQQFKTAVQNKINAGAAD